MSSASDMDVFGFNSDGIHMTGHQGSNLYTSDVIAAAMESNICTSQTSHSSTHTPAPVSTFNSFAPLLN